MDVLIIGSNARTGSARYSQRYITFAGMIKQAHESAGDHVEIRDWSPLLLDERPWAQVYVGLAPPAWVGSDRVYGALITVSDLWRDARLRLFVDDPDIRILRNSLFHAAENPDRLLTRANAKRQNYGLLTENPGLRSRMADGLAKLTNTDNPWPLLVVPAYPWGDAEMLMSPLTPYVHIPDIVGIDPTGLALKARILADPNPGRNRSPGIIVRSACWIAEGEGWTYEVPVRNPIVSVKPTNDVARISTYENALGVLEPQLSAIGIGWWSSRMALAALASTYYASDWRKLRSMAVSEPYIRTLPGAYEDMDEHDRETLVAAQRAALVASTWTADRVLEALDVVTA